MEPSVPGKSNTYIFSEPIGAASLVFLYPFLNIPFRIKTSID